MRDADPKKRLFAGKVLDDMDDFFDDPRNIVAGNPQEASAALTKARENWKIYRKSETLDSIMEVARDRAGQYSVSGHENALRTGFRQLATKIARDKRTRNLFTKDEVALIRQLSRGSRTRDLFKNVGAVLNARNAQFLTGAGVAGAQGFSMYQDGGLDPWSALVGGAVWGVGKGSRALGGAMAKSKANQLRRVVRSGGQMTSAPGDLRLSPMAGTLLGLKQSLGF